VARVADGAPGALALIDAPRAGWAWTGAAGRLVRGEDRRLRAGDAFRAASVTKHVTAVVGLMLSRAGKLSLDGPLADQLPAELLDRWPAFGGLPRTTPRQLLAHTAGLPNYFHDEAFAALLRTQPDRVWRPIELVDHAAAHGQPGFAPGEGFAYSDTGYVVAGILIEHLAGQSLHRVYRDLLFDPLGMEATWLEGHEPDCIQAVADHYSGALDLTAISPTIDWAGGGLVTTTRDLARFLRGLWSGRILGAPEIEELTRWTPGATFPQGHAVRYEQYGLGTGRNVIEGVELIGHTGFIGAFAFHAPGHDAVLVGTHNESEVDRWPLVAELCRELRSMHDAVGRDSE
jgi:D-alanyl-D-alanine carboxypeptidase